MSYPAPRPFFIAARVGLCCVPPGTDLRIRILQSVRFGKTKRQIYDYATRVRTRNKLPKS